MPAKAPALPCCPVASSPKAHLDTFNRTAGTLVLDNRHDTTDLSEIAFTWQAGTSHGSAAASGPPHTRGHTLVFHDLPPAGADSVLLNASSPRGFVINSWRLIDGDSTQAEMAEVPRCISDGRKGCPGDGGGVCNTPRVTPQPGGGLAVTTSSGNVSWVVTAGGSMSASVNGLPVLTSGPDLTVLAQTHGTKLSFEGNEPFSSAVSRYIPPHANYLYL